MCLFGISFSHLSFSLGWQHYMYHPQQANTQKVQGAQNAEVISWKIDLLYKKSLQSIPSNLFKFFLQNWKWFGGVCTVMTFNISCEAKLYRCLHFLQMVCWLVQFWQCYVICAGLKKAQAMKLKYLFICLLGRLLYHIICTLLHRLLTMTEARQTDTFHIDAEVTKHHTANWKHLLIRQCYQEYKQEEVKQHFSFEVKQQPNQLR